MYDYSQEENDKIEVIDLTAKPIPSKFEKTTMSVPEMRKLLGMRKTESYWLIHKGYFKTITVQGKFRVDIASFEGWYANQIKYKKVNGTPPGEILCQNSYSARDISKMLGICEGHVYELLADLEYIKVDYWKRWTKSAFEEWYQHQTKYRTTEDRKKDIYDEARTMSMPEMAWLLGVPRGTVYTILNNPKYADVFEMITIVERKRVTKKSFMKWYKSQHRYKMKYRTIEEAQACKPKLLINERYLTDEVMDVIETPFELEEPLAQEQLSQEPSLPEPEEVFRPTLLSHSSSNPLFYSIEDVMEILNLKRKTVRRKINNEALPARMIAGTYRIPKEEFSQWLEKHNTEGKEDD